MDSMFTFWFGIVKSTTASIDEDRGGDHTRATLALLTPPRQLRIPPTR